MTLFYASGYYLTHSALSYRNSQALGCWYIELKWIKFLSSDPVMSQSLAQQRYSEVTRQSRQLLFWLHDIFLTVVLGNLELSFLFKKTCRTSQSNKIQNQLIRILGEAYDNLHNGVYFLTVQDSTPPSFPPKEHQAFLSFEFSLFFTSSSWHESKDQRASPIQWPLCIFQMPDGSGTSPEGWDHSWSGRPGFWSNIRIGGRAIMGHQYPGNILGQKFLGVDLSTLSSKVATSFDIQLA